LIPSKPELEITMDQLTTAVTGAGSGIGLAAATALAASGAAVVLGDADPERLRAAQSRIEAEVEGAQVETVTVDVANDEQVESFIDSAIRYRGRLDVLVCCAGIYSNCGFADLTGPAWDRTLDVNLRGTMLCSAAAARHMREQGGGRIVMTASINAVAPERNSAAYSASKAAISSLARSAAVDLGADGITANAIAPGWTRSAMTEQTIAASSESSFDEVNAVRRPAEAEELAEVIRWLAIDAPRFLTGSTLVVDGGQTVMAPMPS
jgi:NAD(P)-dependent dehydrogenase (short-subunit alcohol dehydrogenase family)